MWGSDRLGEIREVGGMRLPTFADSPLASSRSRPNSRTVSSIVKRGIASDLRRLAEQALIDQRRDAVEHVKADHPARIGNRLGRIQVNPPTKTARRRKSDCSSGESRS